MVDDVAHLDAVDAVRASPGVRVRVAVDVDAGLRLGSQHVGPKRSPLYDAAAVTALARAVVAASGLRPGRRDDLRGPGRGRARRRARASAPSRCWSDASSRRRSPSSRCAAARSPTPWPSWPTSSSGTAAAPARWSPPSPTRSSPRWPPARGCSCPACSTTTSPSPHARRPSSASASAASPPRRWRRCTAVASSPRDRSATTAAPIPWAPPGLHLTGLEGAGEVQTPLTGHPAAHAGHRRPGVVPARQVGRAVRARQRRAPGARATAIVETVPSYRGLGHAW